MGRPRGASFFLPIPEGDQVALHWLDLCSLASAVSFQNLSAIAHSPARTMRSAEPTAPIASRPWLRGLYALGLLLMVQPIAETLAAGWPLRFGEVGWRFGVAGSFMTLLGTFVVGLGLIALTSHLLEQRAVLRAAGVVAIALACVLMIVLSELALDWVQLRRIVREDIKGGFDLAATKATISALLGVIALAILGYAGIRGSRLPDHLRTKPVREKGHGLVVGKQR